MKIILHDCNYLDDEAISYLPLVKKTLNSLQISSCGDITDQGLAHISELRLVDYSQCVSRRMWAGDVVHVGGGCSPCGWGL